MSGLLDNMTGWLSVAHALKVRSQGIRCSGDSGGDIDASGELSHPSSVPGAF